MTHRARIADIIHHASQLSGVSVEVLLGPSRRKDASKVRQAVMYVARLQRRSDGDLTVYAYSLPTIARALNRDHSTVSHGIEAAKALIRSDLVYRDFITSLIGAAQSQPFVGKVKITAPPVQSVMLKQKPQRFVVPAKNWEIIPLTADHSLVIDEDGKTPEDYKVANNLKTGSRDLAAAMMREMAA